MDELIKWIKIGAIALGGIIVLYTIIALLFPGLREALRDVAIVILAVFQLIVVVMAILLLVALLYTIRLINQVTRETIVPRYRQANAKLDEILDHTRAVAGNARGSAETVSTATTFAAEQAIAPLIRVSGLVAGVRAAASALARRDVDRDAQDDRDDRTSPDADATTGAQQTDAPSASDQPR